MKEGLSVPPRAFDHSQRQQPGDSPGKTDLGKGVELIKGHRAHLNLQTDIGGHLL